MKLLFKKYLLEGASGSLNKVPRNCYREGTFSSFLGVLCPNNKQHGRAQGINPRGTVYASSEAEEWVWTDPSKRTDIFLRTDTFNNSCSITYDAGEEFIDLYEGKD